MSRRPGRRNARGGGGTSAAPSFAAQILASGAIVHWDPSSGATDDGTTSTWVDRIGGYSVASTSQATRLTLSSSIAAMNNRPGWTGVAANSTKLVGAAALAAILDGTQPYTCLVARKAVPAGSLKVLCGAGSTSVGNWAYNYVSTTNAAAGLSRRQASTVANAGTVLSGSNLTIDSFVYDGANVLARSNGVSSLSSTANAQVPVCDIFAIGCAVSSGVYQNFFDGSIGDIVIYSSALSGAPLDAVEALFMARYGTT